MSAVRSLPLADIDTDDSASAPTPAVAPAASLLRFITCGSVDDGKSTLIGRLLYDTKSVFDDQLEALERDSRKFGTTGETLDFALLVDGLSAEREQGITIDVAYRYFSTARRAFIIADTPGHEQYTRNMATGASQADLAVILVDARKGILPQTRRHSFITSMVGIRSVIVAVNKMDLVDFDEATFRRIEADYRALLPAFDFVDISFIPLSAKNGDNLIAPSANTPWYQGPTLLERLETVEAERLAEGDAFRLPVQYVNRPNLDFRGFCGQITSGGVRPGERVLALPSGREATVDTVYGANGPVERASAGEAVTLTLDREIDISRGDVLVRPGDRIAARSEFSAQILSLTDRPLVSGTRLVARLGTAQSPAAIRRLEAAVDIHTFQTRPANALSMNEIGKVVIGLDKALVATLYSESRDLGSFILIDPLTNETVALGIVTALPTEHATMALPGTTGSQAARTSWWSDKVTIYRAVAAVLIGIAALLLGLPLWAAIVLGVVDFLIRPLLRHVMAPEIRPEKPVDPSDVGDGAGI